jgi:hypothetical protein
MKYFSLYIFISAILHVTEEYFYPGGFLAWGRKNVPKLKQRLTVKMAVIVNGLFLLLCGAGVLLAEDYPKFALSIAGLVLVNGLIHIFASIFIKSYSPGLITSIIFYLPISIYIFASNNFSSGEIIIFISYGILYHLAVPLFLFAPFNKPKASA